MTKEEKRNAVNNTISALNGEAYDEANQIKQNVLKSGDKELIETIEHIWDVI